jgi:hypothetical protein
MAKRRRNKSLRGTRRNQTSGVIRRRTTRVNRKVAVAVRQRQQLKPIPVMVESVAVAPSPTGRQRQRETPVKKERSDVRLRVRCKDRPKNNKPQSGGSGRNDFIPWC